MSAAQVSRMFLVDAMAMAFRNYHAFGARPLKTSKGLHTSAVFGCALQMLKLIEDENPDYLVVATDIKEPTFRHKLFPAYKANRSKMPEDLAEQLPWLMRLFEAFGCRLLKRSGVEADDLIGTIASRFSGPELHSFIVSGDKDFMQLITPHISLYVPQKGEKARILGAEGVMEKFGCRPDQVIDVLAIIGDTSDNIPGVHGIGEKGAADLIQKYSSLEGVYENIESITNKRQKDALLANRDMAFLSKTLVTIPKDLPIDLSLEEMRFTNQHLSHADDLLAIFDELEFRGLTQKLKEAVGSSQFSSAPQQMVQPTFETYESNSLKDRQTYTLVSDPETLKKLSSRLESVEIFAFDTETTGLDIATDTPIGMSFSTGPAEAFYVPLLDRDLTGITASDTLQSLAPFLGDPKKIKVGHNLKFDAEMMANVQVPLRGPLRDTMIASWLLDAAGREHGLDHCCLKYLKYRKIPTSDLIGPKGLISMVDVPLDKVATYAMEDADLTLRLHDFLMPLLKQNGLESLFSSCENPLVPVLAEMEHHGVYIDADILTEISGQLSTEIARLEKEIFEIAGETFNINSTKQLQAILFEKLKVHEQLGIKRLKRTQSGFSTDVSVLERLEAHPLPRALLAYRTVTKLKNTYVDTLPQLISPKTGRIHGSFHQTGTATGRLSSSDPNLQNIPIRSEAGQQIRRAFRAKDSNSVIISADYSQIELRLLAHLAQEESLADAFRRGADIHTDTAARIFGVAPEAVGAEMRARAKAINFGIIYGMGPQRLARETNVSFEEAKKFIDRYFETFPGIGTYIDRCLTQARTKGYSETILGRRRSIPELHAKEPQVVANAENIAVNSPVQGSAADLIKLAMVRVHRSLTGRVAGASMLLQVHDELVFECPDSAAQEACSIIKYEMENAMSLSVPLVVGIGVGKNWLEAH